MDRSRTHLAVQCASIALLSVSLWYLYKTRRRNLQKAAAQRDWDLRNWQRELEGLAEAGLEYEDEEEEVKEEEVGSRSVAEEEEDGVSANATRHCCNGKHKGKQCGSCVPKRPPRRTAGSAEHAHHANTINYVQEIHMAHAPKDGIALTMIEGKVMYASQTGHAKTLAEQLVRHLLDENVSVQLVDPSAYEPEDLAQEKLVIFVASTWENGSAPPHASFLGRWLEESAADFRVGSWLLSGCKYAVFGLGSRAYGSTYNLVARSWDRHMADLGATCILDRGEGDEDEGSVEQAFKEWADKLLRNLKSFNASPAQEVSMAKEDADYSEASDDFYTDEDVEEDKENLGEGLLDVEDVAGRLDASQRHDNFLSKSGKRQVFRRKNPNNEAVNSEGEKQGADIKEMVTPIIRSNLEKQGYKIIGSHSGVKLCRWTKSQLRGRGGCYKHSFYGIESHRCMETTPSLACANKCVFCWRHHTNPVGKTWKWKMDDPIEIVEAALDQHTKMIKQMKGVPGVKQERLIEGMNPRHCALSLVGEPIMYPEINKLVAELHKRRISTFLVTNAQFPDRIENLDPVTQLYVSVDAATKERLKAIDRPLFADFWERFIDSMKALQKKRQRTVYRLTLVKGWNTEELEGYADLLTVGQPDFLEIKGVTYCGSSNTSTLTMENVPWHEDVRAFAEALATRSNGKYELACEHAHSCCVLLANAEKFKLGGCWYTWIDYEKFHDLIATGTSFSSEDYMAPTPEWAVYGSAEGGFDPKEVRVRKERRHGILKPDSGGCT